MFMVFIVMCSVAGAEDKGKFPGAVWQYEMSPAAKGDKAPESRKGGFRINGNEIFQPRGEKSVAIGKIIGKEGPKKKTVTVEFESLRGSDGKTIAAKGLIEYDSPGEVHGRLVDGDGTHWNFKASRVQE
jgi:hypothetical protein